MEEKENRSVHQLYRGSQSSQMGRASDTVCAGAKCLRRSLRYTVSSWLLQELHTLDDLGQGEGEP